MDSRTQGGCSMVRSLRLLVPALVVALTAGAALLFAPTIKAQTSSDPCPPDVGNNTECVTGVEFETDGPYKLGSEIKVKVTFSAPVGDYQRTNPATSTIELVVNNDTANPRLAKVRNPSLDTPVRSLVFKYTVTGSDADGPVSVPAGDLAPDDRLEIDVSNQLDERHPAATVRAHQDQRIDNTAPTLQTLAVTSEGPYGVGSIIKITATFDDDMGDATGATLKLQIGGVDKTAEYSPSDSSGMAVVFAYTVVSGDEGAVSVPDGSITGTGTGTVTDSAGNSASALDFTGASAGTSPDVDPEVVVTQPDSTGSTGTADTTEPTVTYRKPGSLTVGIRIRTIAPNTDDTDIASYAVKEGSSLPATLRLDGTTGNITGRPTRAVSRSTTVTIEVCDTSGNCADTMLALPQIADPEADQPTPAATLPTVADPDLSAVNVGDAAPSPWLQAAIAATGGALMLGGMLALRSRHRVRR